MLKEQEFPDTIPITFAPCEYNNRSTLKRPMCLPLSGGVCTSDGYGFLHDALSCSSAFSWSVKGEASCFAFSRNDRFGHNIKVAWSDSLNSLKEYDHVF